MKDPIFLLQSGGPLQTEKVACSFSNYPIRYCSFGDITMLDSKAALTQFVPVGSVEFVQAYSQHVNLVLPEDFSYGYEGHLDKYLTRSIRLGTYGEASTEEFVKPIYIKLFTGNIKEQIELETPGLISDDTPVWISEPVPFEAEFRFYIRDSIGGGKILGWSRYDGEQVINPIPDSELVNNIMKDLESIGAPGAYTIDIGWRPDLNQYCLVELNDAWSLGFYENNDPQSNPPSRQEYADMLVFRWIQILFSNLV
jgi:hypothetical protein